MNNAIGTRNVSECLDDDITPVPPAVPGEFMVHLGADWGGSLHNLADEMGSFELGAEATAAGLLSWIESVEFEVRGLEGFDDLVERLRQLRGAVMMAAAADQHGLGTWLG